MMNQLNIFWLCVSVGFFSWMLGCFVWMWRGYPELGESYNMGVIVGKEIVWDAGVRQ